MAGGAQNILLQIERAEVHQHGRAPSNDSDLFQFSLVDCGKSRLGCADFARLPVSVFLFTYLVGGGATVPKVVYVQPTNIYIFNSGDNFSDKYPIAYIFDVESNGSVRV